MPWPPPPTHLLAIVLVSILAACHGGGSSATGTSGAEASSPPTTPSTVDRPTTTVDPQAADKSAIRKVAEGWHAAADRLGAAPNPEDPALDTYLTGQLLDDYRALWDSRQRDGVVSRPAVHSRAMYRIDGIAVTGSVALLRECVIDDDLLVDHDHRVINDDVESAEMVTTARRVAHGWKLSARSSKRMKGIAGCALSR